MAPLAVPAAISGAAASIVNLVRRSGPAAVQLSSSILRRSDALLTHTSTIQTRQDQDEADVPKQPSYSFPHGQGTVEPERIPTNALFAIFGLIGAAFVITAIWFFFITPNGGFVFKEGDWEDYKSTVLRRKGPNGTTLSGATESTDLGGGSVVGRRERRRFKRLEKGKGEKGSEFTDETSYTGYDAHKSDISGSTAVTESLVGTEYTRAQTEDAMTSITRGVSGRYQREKIQFSRRDQLKLEKEAAKAAKRAEKAAKERAKEEAKNRRRGKYRDEESSVGFPPESAYGYDDAPAPRGLDDDAATSVYDDRDIKRYREEKPARVGGINMPTSSTAFGSAAGTSDVTESLISNRQETPTHSPEKKSRREREPRERRVRDDVYTEVSVESPSPTKKTGRERERGGAGIRKVDTVYEADRIKAEQRRLRDRGRAAAANSSAAAEQRKADGTPKRNFSYTPGDDGLSKVSEESREERRARRAERQRERGTPGGYGYNDSEISGTTATSDSTGTKAYHHPIPGLSSSAAGTDDYAEDRRRRRAEGANYRRS